MQKKLFILTLLALNPLALGARKPSQQSLTKAPLKLVDALTTNTPTPLATTQQTAKKDPIKRIVRITNNIKPEMLLYKHWSGNKKPDPFSIIVDGKELEAGKTTTVTVEDDTLNVQYNYSFMMGYRKGKREVTFKVPEKKETLGMTFSWDNENRVILDNAPVIQKREI